MTEPWEEAMERLGRLIADPTTGFIERDLATIRKHIERLEEALRWLETCNPDINDVNSIAATALRGETV